MGIGSRKMEEVVRLAAAAWNACLNKLGENDTKAPILESSSQKPPKKETSSQESSPGTPLQETGTNVIKSDKSCVACNVWCYMDH